jgi:hypothetical protein
MPSDTSNSNVEVLLKQARDRKHAIKQSIEEIDRLPNPAVQPSNPNVPLSNAAVQLSDPAFTTKLPFPFVGATIPKRFNIGHDNMWFYMGREKFMELLNTLDEPWRKDRAALWVYGTRGYGKSHLLAALVCLLSARKERVVYIPDCRDCLKAPTLYFRAAMLLTWADDDDMQKKIINLSTMEQIHVFFKKHRAIFVIDQMNTLEVSKNDKNADKKKCLDDWLEHFRVGHKAVLSCSANYQTYLELSQNDTTDYTLTVHGGLTPVSLESVAEGDFLTVI